MQLDRYDRQILELTALREMLRHIADCPAPSHMECPTFRRLVEDAGRRLPVPTNPPAPIRSAV